MIRPNERTGRDSDDEVTVDKKSRAAVPGSRTVTSTMHQV
jgi:hypothetical protein